MRVPRARRPVSNGAGTTCPWRCDVWAYRLVAPYTFERLDVPSRTPEDLTDRHVLLRFMAAGVCGSDLPPFRGVRGKIAGDTGLNAAMCCCASWRRACAAV